MKKSSHKAKKVNVVSKLVAKGKTSLRKKLPTKRYIAEEMEAEVKKEKQEESDKLYEEVTLVCKFFGLY